MRDYALLISPLARAAYFGHVIEVAQAELAACATEVDVQGFQTLGGMSFAMVRARETAVEGLARLSVVQGIFAVSPDGWIPVEAALSFNLHDDFVWGEKYRGKTNETLTQMLLNLGRAQVSGKGPMRLLDPMCGRGTTLIWALRYGISAVGIEQDAQALAEIRRGLKKWSKLHRQKHKITDGWVQKANRRGEGKFLEFTADGRSAKFITGDSVDAVSLVGRKPFDLIVTDLPYGVQHMGGPGSRSPLVAVKAAAPGWAQLLAPGGAMVIAFNANIPKRSELLSAFDGLGLKEVQVGVAHRMSESILRDVLVMTKSLD